MKLIDLLVQELPKRGGWTDGVCKISTHASGQVFFDGRFAPRGFTLPVASDAWNKYKHPYSYTNSVTREQYESALAESQKQTWSGEGLPPVGMHCKIVDPDGVLMYGQGESGEVIAHVENTAVIRMSYGLGCFEARFLRPARSEADKKREVAAQALCDSCGGTGKVDESLGFGIMWFDVYDAIAAGKIPGVKLKD